MDIYAISSPIFHIARFFGLASYTLVVGDFQKVYSYSKFWLCYGIFWSCLFCFVATFLYRMDVDNELTDFYRYSLITVLILFFGITLASQIISLINGKRIVKIYKQIDKYDRALNLNPVKSQLYKIVNAESIASFIIMLFVYYICSIGLMQYFKNAGILLAIYFWLMSLSAETLLWIINSQFIYLVIMLKQRFSYLNQLLQCATEKLTMNYGTLIEPVTILNSKICIRNANIARLHEELCGIMEYVNSTFSFQMILVLARSFFQTTWFSFVLAIKIIMFFRGERTLFNEDSTFSLLIVIVMSTVKILTSGVICSQTVDEVSCALFT